METAIGGLCIVSTAMYVSRLLAKWPAKNQDYTGPTGMSFTKRTAVAPAQSIDQRIRLGHAIGQPPINNIQTRLFEQAAQPETYLQHTDLALAAAIPGLEPGSISSILTVGINPTENCVNASIVSSSREGDFIYPAHSKFEDLLTYTKLISKLL